MPDGEQSGVVKTYQSGLAPDRYDAVLEVNCHVYGIPHSTLLIDVEGSNAREGSTKSTYKKNPVVLVSIFLNPTSTCAVKPIPILL